MSKTLKMKQNRKNEPLHDAYIGEISLYSDKIEKYINSKISAGLMSQHALSAVFSPMEEMRMRDQHIYLNYLVASCNPNQEAFTSGIFTCQTDDEVLALVDKAFGILPSKEQNAAFDSLHALNAELIVCTLTKKNLSEEDVNILLSPMSKLGWASKKYYSDALLPIVKNSKSSQEIIKKAQELVQKLFPKDFSPSLEPNSNLINENQIDSTSKQKPQ